MLKITSTMMGCTAMLLFADSTPAGATMTLTDGLQDYQVLQRADDGLATAQAGGQASAEGAIQARVMCKGAAVNGKQWEPAGQAANGKWSATVSRLPTGGPYTIEFQLVSGGGPVAEVKADNILVGDLWVLAGQSNMEGCAPLAGCEEPSIYVNVFAFRDLWMRAEEPLHWRSESNLPVYNENTAAEEIQKRWREGRDPHRTGGVGPGLPFAKELHRLTNVPIGLIPCAYGGTSMDQWSPDKKAAGGKSLYGGTLIRIARAGGKVKGILWYQGESDTPGDGPAKYQEKMVHLIESFRKDLNQPNLGFYYVQLSRTLMVSPFDPGWNVVREIQRQLEGLIPNTGVVAAADLPLSDGIHVGTPGHSRLGPRLAKLAARNLYGVSKFQPGPHPTKAILLDATSGVIRLELSGVNGALNPQTNIPGFTIADATGATLAPFVDVSVDPAHPQSLLMHTGGQVPEDLYLWYGRGVNTYVNLVDSEDLALLLFGPLRVEKP